MATGARHSGTVEEALAEARGLLDRSPDRAAARARAIIAADPANADAFRLLGRALRAAGDDGAAGRAELDAISASIHDVALIEAAAALARNDLPVAERLLRTRLKQDPFDVAAIRMMAELAARLGRLLDAEKLLRRALELAPSFAAARANLATVLNRQDRPAEAIAELDRLLGDDPDNAAHRNLKAAALGRIGGYDEALGLYEDILARFPDQPKLWMSYGHVLKTVGRRDEGVAAYRRALALAPGMGEAYWSLANLKTVGFDGGDIAAMEAALARRDLSNEDRFHLHFALGKAFEDARHHEASFRHYAEGNRLRRAAIDYDPGETTALVDRAIAFFTPALFAALGGRGDPAPDPIFILGMPRAGSTLIEQILASHSAVEGTIELPDIPAMARRLSGRRLGTEGSAYPACLAGVPGEELRALGAEYLDATRIHRKAGKRFFIDKMPNNWAHVGLIRLILPNARIVDARRDPLDCCFSNFKQHFARGQAFSYSLEDMGRYYSDYLRLMAHFDAVQPGAVHRVVHEALVDDLEGEVRRLLACLGLPFEEACLRFWETDRAVRTASSEQVRRPINRDGMGQWKPYAEWLGPLRDALGIRQP